MRTRWAFIAAGLVAAIGCREDGRPMSTSSGLSPSKSPLLIEADQETDMNVEEEAKVLMAYGRYHQVEELLNNALLKEPGNINLQMILLENYALSNNKYGFLRTFATLPENLVESNPKLWQKASELHEKYFPSNVSREPQPVTPDQKPTENQDSSFDIELLENGDESEQPFDALSSAEKHLEPSSDDEDSNTVDFDINFEEELKPSSVSETGETDEAAHSENTIEFESSINTPLDKQEISEQPVTSEKAEQLQAKEIATKLDLARVYVDMGDKAEAQALLNEIIEKGDAYQQQEAQALLNRLP